MTNHKIISEIYHIETEKVRITGNPSINRLKRMQSDDTVEQLQSKLNPEEKALLDKLLDQWIDMEVASNEESFIQGFKIGAKLRTRFWKKNPTLASNRIQKVETQ